MISLRELELRENSTGHARNDITARVRVERPGRVRLGETLLDQVEGGQILIGRVERCL